MILVVGEAPGPSSDPERPLEGDSGERLARVAGASLARLLSAIVPCNLLDAYPGARWPARLAESRAVELRELALEQGLGLALLGARVARAFGLELEPVLAWRELAGVRVATSPHPSGKSRWWNDEGNRDRASAFWREVVSPSPRSGPSSVARGRSEPEVDWLLDLAEDAYVRSGGSEHEAVRRVMREHVRHLEYAIAVSHLGRRFTPSRPLARSEARACVRRARARWRATYLRAHVDERRAAHHEVLAAAAARAELSGEWPTVARLLKLQAEVDELVGRGDAPALAPPSDLDEGRIYRLGPWAEPSSGSGEGE